MRDDGAWGERGTVRMHIVGETQQWDPFPPVRRDDSADRRGANRAVGLSAIGLGLTGLIELTFALLSGSVGLLGDALHNLSDVSTSAVVWLGFRISKRPASASHPFGFERAEDLAGLGVALVIWASAVFAAVVSYHKLVEHGRTTHLGFAMAAAIVGMIGNQLVSRADRRPPHPVRHLVGRCQALLARLHLLPRCPGRPDRGGSRGEMG